MRQKDDKLYAEKMNRLREGNQSAEDIKEFKKRCISTSDENYPIHAPHAFTENRFVDNHNCRVYEVSNTEKVPVKCQDNVLGDLSEEVKKAILSKVSKNASNTANLPHNINIAVHMCYETTVNVSVEDGIVNGAPCTVQHIQYFEQNSPIPSIIWVKFECDEVGVLTRQKYHSFYTKAIDKSWTPIFACKRSFSSGPQYKTVVRQQFPLRPAAGKTNHKVQGQSLKELVVDLSTTRNYAIHGMHYVAFSRVTTEKGLHILNLNESNISVNPAVVKEMNRLRNDSRLILNYKPVYSLPKNHISIIFQNAQSLHRHFKDLSLDQNFIASDIVCIAVKTEWNRG